MKTYKPLLLTAIAILLAINTFAQLSAKALVNEGVQLHDAGKFDQAIEKYKQALQAEPENATALYEIANTLYTIKNYNDALKNLDKLVKIQASPDAYSMYGNIYDDLKQPDKAIDYYKKGINAFPDFQMLHFNLAIAYARQGKYPEAASALIPALQLNPNHASSHRLYAMISKELKNDADAIMACCNFLLLEPQSQRSTGMYNTLQGIIQSKVTKTGDKSITITVNDKKDGDESIFALETMLSMLAASPTLEKSKGKTSTEIFQEQLDSFFRVAGELSEKKKDKTFLWKFYADYFYALAKSGNMQAFTHYISLSATDGAEHKKWLTENVAPLNKLSAWVAETKHVTQ